MLRQFFGELVDISSVTNYITKNLYKKIYMNMWNDFLGMLKVIKKC